MYLTNNGIVREPNEEKPGYLQLINDKSTQDNPNENEENPQTKKLALKPDLYKNTSPATSDIITSDKNIALFDNNNDSESYLNVDAAAVAKYNKRQAAYNSIDKTRTVISLASTIAKVTQNDQFSDLLDSSDGALTASKGFIDLNESGKSSNKTKSILSSVSQVASGVGTVLNVVDIPEAQFLTFTGQVVGLGVEQQDLGENIKKKNARGIAGHSVSIVRGGWGAVVSGVSAAKLAANIGMKIGQVKPETVAKIATTSANVTKLADKIAVPFSIAGTGLTLWDWIDSGKKVDAKKEEIINLHENNQDYDIYKDLRMDSEDESEKKAQIELKTLKTNSTIMGISFGLSAISSTAMVISLVSPSAKAITGPLALVTSIGASVTGAAASDSKRKMIVKGYETVKEKYDGAKAEVANFIFHKEKIN